MSDYASRVSALKSEQARLVEQQAELTAQRRVEIAKLAEKLGVLEADDDALIGALLDLKDALQNNHARLRQWRDAGATFRRSRSDSSRRHGAETSPHRNGAGAHPAA